MSTASDPAHCGACDSPCAADEVCVSGACTALCGGFELCGGQCVDVTTSPLHCGMCGNTCPVGSGCAGGSCALPTSCLAVKTNSPAAPTGVYTIDVDGAGPKAPFAARCDMGIAGGGWTLALNLDTSDGHVMWWGNALWTNTATLGTAANALTQDHKSEAYNSLTGATEILVVVHTEGAPVGYKRFRQGRGRPRCSRTCRAATTRSSGRRC